MPAPRQRPREQCPETASRRWPTRRWPRRYLSRSPFPRWFSFRQAVVADFSRRPGSSVTPPVAVVQVSGRVPTRTPDAGASVHRHGTRLPGWDRAHGRGGLGCRVLNLCNASGPLAQAYGAVDWSATPLGRMEQWSTTLRHTVDLMLATRFPITLFWGPE